LKSKASTFSDDGKAQPSLRKAAVADRFPREAVRRVVSGFAVVPAFATQAGDYGPFAAGEVAMVVVKESLEARFMSGDQYPVQIAG
jgi:hypothetical protein